MPRREDADPLLLQVVSQRLARLLADTTPGRADSAADAGSGSERKAEAASTWVDTEFVEVEDVPPPRRFSRRHLVVVCVLLLAGLLWTGWSMLRARPVALASPVSVSASAQPGGPSSGSSGPVLPAPPGPTGSAATTAVPSGLPTTAGVVVHVLGAVHRPGLVTLADRARVQDAIRAAGGFTRDADPGDLNLAQLLQDGQQVVIGTSARPTGEVRSSGAAADGPDPASGAGAGAGTGTGGAAPLLDLNSATESQLEELSGVGPVTAGKIAAWRTAHGRFSRIEELQEVDGIGPKTYAEIAPHVRV